jgi:uncharacterized RDD family membrane protein YckC
MFCPKCGAEIGEGAEFCPNCGLGPTQMQTQAGNRHGPVERGYAGFWKRFAARIIDLVIVGVVTSAIGLAIAYGSGWSGVFVWRVFGAGGGPETISGGVMAATWVVTLLLNWLYFTLLESSGRQATVGKMALGIVVTDLNDARISFAKANARFWSQVLLGLVWLVLVVGYIMAGFTEKKQALHDLVASTLVVNRDYR